MKNIHAFPRPIGGARTDRGQVWSESQRGMSLKQFYIGCAITGLLSNPNVVGQDNQWNYSYKEIAKAAQEQADELINE